MSTAAVGVPPLLARLDGRARALTRRMSVVGVIGMLTIGILTTLDVVILRGLFSRPIPGSNEFLNTIFAVAIASVLASGLAERANLEIDALKGRFGPRRTAWLRALAAAIFVVVLALIAWRLAVHTFEQQGRGVQTVILQWKMAPFLWAISALVALCVPVQLVVCAGAVAEARALAIPARPGDDRGAFVGLLALLGLAVVLAAGAYFAGQAAQPLLAAHGATFAAVMCVLLWGLILLFIPVGAAMAMIGIAGAGVLMGFGPAMSVIGSETAGLLTNADLAVLPLFLMMGGFATASGMSSDIYRLAHAVFAPFRGGLAYATIGGCAGFGALSGTSMGTVATIGGVALPEMRKRGYSIELTTGCITAGGTLGQLVPPGTAIVIYALLVEESVGKLFIAVIVPALITVLLYMTAVYFVVWRNPAAAPGREPFDLREVFAALRRCGAVFALFFAVIGGIFAGVFTATEAASVGAALAFGVAWWRGKLRGGALWEVIADTTRSTAMIYMLIIGAMILTFFVGTSGLTNALTTSLGNSGLPPLAVVAILVVVYVLLGTAMDGFTIMIITAPIVAAVVQKLGFDPVWWGVLMIVLVELGEVTPPFGINLFMMKSLAPEVPMGTIFRGVMPFVVADSFKVVLLVLFPALTLWLPSLAFK